jgi:hypothetical protein
MAACYGQQYVIFDVRRRRPSADAIGGNQRIDSQRGGLVADTAGNFYFTPLFCVFKLDSSGVLTRIAGNGRAGYSGDGGPAIYAQLNPAGVAVDSQGNLLFLRWTDQFARCRPRKS